MATNPYSYGSLGQRWTVGEPTSKSLLDVSRVKADANRWALEQLIVDPDDTANFVLTAPGLNIDSNTLYVDSVYNSVGFRLTNPNDYAFNGTPSWVASGGAGNASVILVSGTTSIGYFAFADGTTGTDRYSGNIQYNHSTNTMSFNTNGGVEAMTINSAQDLAVDGDTLYIDASADRVGINTASPSALIHAIQGGEPPAEGMLILEANSSSRQLRIQPPTNADNGFFDARGGNMTFLDDGTEIFRYNASTFSTSSGINVGIGTSSAGEKLTVVGGNSTTSTANFTGGAAANDNATLASDYGMFFQIDANNTVGGRIYNWRVGGKGYSDGTSLMTLTSAGQLGLGTSSPTSPGSTGRFMQISNSSGSAGINLDHTTHNSWDIYNYQGALGFYDETATRMTLTSTGLGIGSSSPLCRLDLEGAGGGSPTGAIPSGGLFVRVTDTATVGEGAVLRLQSTNGAKETAATIAAVHTSGNNGDLTFGLYGGGATHPEGMRLTSAGNLLIGYTSSNGSYKLQVNSQIFATNATIATSDGRYKEEVQTLSNATDLVTRLNPVQFKWKSHEIHNLDVGKTDVGFIAQEVQEVLSDTDYSDSVVVTNKTDDEEYLGLGETKLIPLLTAALQEAITKIETLETKVAALEAA